MFWNHSQTHIVEEDHLELFSILSNGRSSQGKMIGHLVQARKDRSTNEKLSDCEIKRWAETAEKSLANQSEKNNDRNVKISHGEEKEEEYGIRERKKDPLLEIGSQLRGENWELFFWIAWQIPGRQDLKAWTILQSFEERGGSLINEFRFEEDEKKTVCYSPKLWGSILASGKLSQELRNEAWKTVEGEENKETPKSCYKSVMVLLVAVVLGPDLHTVDNLEGTT